MTEEEKWQLWYSDNIKIGVNLGLECLPNDLEPKDLAGQVAEGPLQAAVPEGLVN